jgi:hypothetical protein
MAYAQVLQGLGSPVLGCSVANHAFSGYDRQ